MESPVLARVQNSTHHLDHFSGGLRYESTSRPIENEIFVSKAVFSIETHKSSGSTRLLEKMKALSSKGKVMVWNNFSYKHYELIIQRHKQSIVDFSEVLGNSNPPENFTIIRHDVEFSVERALKLAKLEHDLGISSTYLFQSCSSAYNVASHYEASSIKAIAQLGHKIGLHFYLPVDFNLRNLEKELVRQAKILELGVGLSVDRFSWHRPTQSCLEIRDDTLFGFINVYGKSFFEYSDNPSRITYIADSRHRFDYGCPLTCVESGWKQFLFHPDEWSRFGCETDIENFEVLIREANQDFREVINKESPYLGREGKSIEDSNIRQ